MCGNGNIVKITDTTGAIPVELNYTYDAKGQLKTAQVNKPTGVETVSYSYDGTSNRISETWKNNQNQILSQYTYTYQPGDYLVSKTDPSSVVNYTWDIYGQLSSKSCGENYIFTGKRNLNTVTESNTVKELYTYDALGRRLKVQNADTTTLNFPLGNDTSYEVKKEGTDTTVTKYISANGKYLAKTVKVNTNPEQKYFHHIDLVGSIRAITDSTGTVIASYEYEPFGVTVKTTGSDQDNLGFTGKRMDAGSGLSYFGARYYDSEMGRFISRDPAQDGRNWFVYCSNNPLKYVDLSGLMQTVSDWLKDPLGNASELGGYGDPGSYWDDWDKEEVKLIVPSVVDKLYDSDASYSSSDMAAMAFGTKINDLSINFNIEFGAYIYSRKDNTYNFSKPYTSYATGFVMSMTATVPYGTSLDSRIHTHSAFLDGRVECFSPSDIRVAYSKKVNSYVVTPGGKLYKFNYDDLTITYLPVDSSFPKDRNYVYNESIEQYFLTFGEDALKSLKSAQ